MIRSHAQSMIMTPDESVVVVMVLHDFAMTDQPIKPLVVVRILYSDYTIMKCNDNDEIIE